MKSILKNQKGYTFVEILLVVVIILISAGIVIVLIKPSKQFDSISNEQKQSESTILNTNNQTSIATSSIENRVR